MITKEEINMLKEALTVAKIAKKSGLFLGGLAFGTIGLKVLASKFEIASKIAW